MRKYGSPEQLRPVSDEAEPQADPQGINVMASRQEAEQSSFEAEGVIKEGEERDE